MRACFIIPTGHVGHDLISCQSGPEQPALCRRRWRRWGAHGRSRSEGVGPARRRTRGLPPSLSGRAPPAQRAPPCSDTQRSCAMSSGLQPCAACRPAPQQCSANTFGPPSTSTALALGRARLCRAWQGAVRNGHSPHHQGGRAGAGRSPAALAPDRNALLGARAEAPTSAFQGEERGGRLRRRRGRLRRALVQVNARALCARFGAGRSAARMA